MKDIIPAKKQSPILGLSGMGGGVGSNIVAGLAEDPIYVDDVFSTYLYKGTGSDQSFNNGIKLGNSNSGSGVEFDGSGDYLELAANSDLNLDGDFTIEAWVKVDDLGWSSVRRTLLANNIGWTTNHAAISLMNSASSNEENTIILYNNTSTIADSSPVRIEPSDGWTHIAITRSGSTIKIFKNGVQAGSTATYSGEFKFGTGATWIGAITMSTGSTPETYDGKISNLRVIKGTALYTSNFTPPTAELTSVTNTKLLCCNNSVMKTATVTPDLLEIAVKGHPHASGGPFTAIDGEGGMIWSKGRDGGGDFPLLDTERGIDKLMFTNGTWSQEAAAANDKANTFRSFDNNGYTIGTTGYLNNGGTNYTSWTWRKQKGFFDIVTYSGDGTTRDLAHNLGCIPGVIILKRLDVDGGWQVYHRDLPNTANPAWSKILRLDTDGTQQDAYCLGSSSTHTSSTIRIGNDNSMNTTGGSYVAYLFAGGESTAATARSVDFDGSGDSLDSNTSSDYDLGTGDFTLEYWFYNDVNATQLLFDKRTATTGNNAYCTYIDNGNYHHKFFAFGNDRIVSKYLPKKQWYHAAIVRSSGVTKMYINGTKEGATYTDTNDYNTETFRIGGDYQNATYYDGKISNLRLVKGTAVYTSDFKPPTKPLASISGTVFLACNNASITGTTTGSLTSNGDPTASTDSPFDDPDGFKFGEDADQNIIKCGSYIGNADTTNGTRVYVGFEPQWLLIKPTGFGEHWHCFDCMRGMVNGGNDYRLEVNNSNNTETTAVDFLNIHPDGFTALFNPNINGTTGDFVYIAVRRPDGYVGKPPEAGTDVLGLADSINSNDLEYISGFPVDYALARRPGASENWYATGRLNQKFYMWTNQTNTENSTGTSNTQFCFDDSRGWSTQSWGTSYQSWMWKRNAGFDVVNYKGDGSSGRDIPHSLGQVPEMMWVKGRGSDVANWYVYHNAVGNQKVLQLESTDRETSASVGYWNYTDPTSTHFSIGINPNTNNNNYLTILFASVDGISKVGSFAGSSSDVTLNLGFVPRFLMVKGRTGPSGTNWTVWDNIRGITGNYTSGGADTPRMYLNATSASSVGANDNVFAVDSGGVKGITIVTGPTWNNHQDFNYIYYAHA